MQYKAILATVLVSLSVSSTVRADQGMLLNLVRESAKSGSGKAVVNGARSAQTGPRRSLIADIRGVEQSLNQIDLRPETMEAELERMYQFLLNADPSTFDLQEISSNAESIIRSAFRLRLALRERVLQWTQEGRITDRSMAAIRNILRAGRYLEDTIGESVEPQLQHLTRRNQEGYALPFQGLSPIVLTPDNKNFGYWDFKAGDLILMRGSSPVSAAIARVTSVASQFSHVGMVHVDPATGGKYLVEALIETGAHIVPLDKELSSSIARMVVYRPVDEALGLRASTFAYEKVSESLASGRRIRYDFSMNFADPERLFCSELVSWAYESVSARTFRIPLHRSKIALKNRDFLRRITIADSTNDTFAPGDIDLDSRFRVVAEFRDFKRTETSRVDDLILDRIFQWMETENRVLDEKRWMKWLTKAAHKVSPLQFMRNLGQKNGIPLDPDVTPRIMSSVLVIQFTKSRFQKSLKPMLEEYRARVGYPMPPKVIYEKLDQIKASDPKTLEFLPRAR